MLLRFNELLLCIELTYVLNLSSALFCGTPIGVNSQLRFGYLQLEIIDSKLS